MKLKFSFLNKFRLSFVYTKEVSAALIINLMVIVFVFLIQKSLPPVIPLFYGMPYGSEQLTSSISLILPPLIAMAITVVNSFLITLTNDDFLQKVLLVAMYTTTLLSTITVLKIVSLVSNIL